MLLNIYMKEMKDCFRDRRTLLLTVFLPIIMMTGLILFYEKNVSDGEGEIYKLAVDKSLTKEEVNIFSGFNNIELVKVSDPEEAFKEGEAQAALVLDTDFINTIEDGGKASVTIIGDSFSQNSANLMNFVTNALAILEKNIISERLQKEGTNPDLIQPFTINQKEVSEENPNIGLIAMLVPMILALAISVGAGPAASDLFAGEKEKKTMEALLMTPVNRSTLLFSKWLTITTIGAITGMVTLVVVAFEIQYLTEHLKKAVSFGDQTYLIIGLAVLISIVYAMFIASLLMLTSIIGKTVKESQSYSTPIMMVAMFPVMIIASTGINELSFSHFAIPILNLFSLLKELLFGVINYEHILIAIGSNLICMLIVFVIGRILFLKDKWVMN
ncbi:ABC transporter permease [Bacillus sp. 31A1R]|uniref:ABC transporter permease n=1 Tax=Robertmurraya mangrovi TaxID=3098077 RepID=A0ABU5J2L6_9BACI|nr:ABC transporter permease [Bacillus sp. 31A1R]MDZ5473660.1 ABC transporter permease [Bacillus sp. 31A1R]